MNRKLRLLWFNAWMVVNLRKPETNSFVLNRESRLQRAWTLVIAEVVIVLKVMKVVNNLGLTPKDAQ